MLLVSWACTIGWCIVVVQFLLLTACAFSCDVAVGYPPIYYNATNITDVFNADTGVWSTMQLSDARFSLSATSDGNVAMFAGGVGG